MSHFSPSGVATRDTQELCSYEFAVHAASDREVVFICWRLLHTTYSAEE